MAALLKISGLRVVTPHGAGTRVLLRDVNLTIGEGEAVGLVGESGSGKSMTARAISHLLPAGATAAGRISLRGEDVLGLSGKELRDYRRREIAMIFQDPRAHINPVRTVGDFVTESLRQSGTSRSTASDRAESLLRDVRLPNPRDLLSRFPHELSGGMLQRVMIAAALAGEPRLILADEPTTSLDVTIQAEVMSILDALRREQGVAMLFITHDLELAAATCDRTVVMYAGAVVEEQESQRLNAAPQHPYTKALLESRPRLEKVSHRLAAIPGRPLAAYEVETACAFQPRCLYSDERCVTEAPALRRTGDGRVACHYAGELRVRSQPQAETSER